MNGPESQNSQLDELNKIDGTPNLTDSELSALESGATKIEADVKDALVNGELRKKIELEIGGAFKEAGQDQAKLDRANKAYDAYTSLMKNAGATDAKAMATLEAEFIEADKNIGEKAFDAVVDAGEAVVDGVSDFGGAVLDGVTGMFSSNESETKKVVKDKKDDETQVQVTEEEGESVFESFTSTVGSFIESKPDPEIKETENMGEVTIQFPSGSKETYNIVKESMNDGSINMSLRNEKSFSEDYTISGVPAGKEQDVKDLYFNKIDNPEVDVKFKSVPRSMSYEDLVNIGNYKGLTMPVESQVKPAKPAEAQPVPAAPVTPAEKTPVTPETTQETPVDSIESRGLTVRVGDVLEINPNTSLRVRDKHGNIYAGLTTGDKPRITAIDGYEGTDNGYKYVKVDCGAINGGYIALSNKFMKKEGENN